MDNSSSGPSLPTPIVAVLVCWCVGMVLGMVGGVISWCKGLVEEGDKEGEERRPRARSTETSEPDRRIAGDERAIRSKTQIFTYAEIVDITNDFEKVIGRGGYAIVYRGSLSDGTRVAAKVLRSSTYSPDAFQTEVELLMRIHHRDLVSLIGYCNEGSNMVLIYEYMSQGNLKEILSASETSGKILSWGERLRIALSSAQGLEYLHNGCKPSIIHRDVKTANILLNEKMEAKIADFGISKILATDVQTHTTTGVIGTFGYLDPEYAITSRLTEKSDVYSFGVILLELMTGQPAIIQINNSESVHIVEWVQSKLEEADMAGVMDPKLGGKFNADSARKVLETAKRCVPRTSIQRITMTDVVNELKESLAIATTQLRTATTGNDDTIRHLSLELGGNIAAAQSTKTNKSW